MTKLYEKKLLVSQPNRYVHAYEVENNYVLDILNLIMIPYPMGWFTPWTMENCIIAQEWNLTGIEKPIPSL